MPFSLSLIKRHAYITNFFFFFWNLQIFECIFLSFFFFLKNFWVFARMIICHDLWHDKGVCANLLLFAFRNVVHRGMDRIRRSFRESFRKRVFRGQQSGAGSSGAQISNTHAGCSGSGKSEVWLPDEAAVRNGTCSFNVKVRYKSSLLIFYKCSQRHWIVQNVKKANIWVVCNAYDILSPDSAVVSNQFHDVFEQMFPPSPPPASSLYR